MNETMNSKQLFHALYCNDVTNNVFDGVYASDQLENIIFKPKLVIANTQPSQMNGEHWIAFYFDGNCVDVFDSLALELKMYISGGNDLDQFIKRYASLAHSPNIRVQPRETDICGEMCLYFAYFRTLGYSLQFILQKMCDVDRVLDFVEKQFTLTSKECLFAQSCLNN